MNHDRYDDSYIRGILNAVKNIAVVGASPGDNRPSMFVVKYLAERGYRIFPINPGRGGQDIGGEKAYARLADVPEKIDMVDVFRNSESVPPILDEALALSRRPDVFWMQQGIRNAGVAAKAEAAGMKVVMDRCPKIEYGRLSGEINWVGVNTRTLSSKRAQRLPGGVQRLKLGDDKAGG
jgi:predicted CoA-binding protein